MGPCQIFVRSNTLTDRKSAQLRPEEQPHPKLKLSYTAWSLLRIS
jgi:hypothetical protein